MYLSATTYSPWCTRVATTPVLVWKPVGKTRAAGLPTRAASRPSSSRWMGRVPFRKRDPAQPVPYWKIAAAERSLILGWVVSSR